MKLKIFRILSIVLLLFQGFGAVYGAWMLISDPSGGKFGFPLELLNATPFNNYLIPGIVLLLFIGVLPAYIAIIAIRKKNNYSWWIIIQGVILVGWLTAELLLNIDFFVPAMHYPFYTIGVLLIVLGRLQLYQHRS